MNINTENTPPVRFRRIRTSVLAGTVTLVAGLTIGVTAAELHSEHSVASKPDTTASNPTLASSSNQWNPFQEMRDMQSQMDRMFNQMNQQFSTMPALQGIGEIPGYSSSLDVRDLKNRYEIHAYLPDAKESNVHVTLNDNRTVKVEVGDQTSQTSSSKATTTHVTTWGQFQQVVQLPAPVKSDQMKITRHGHELLITLPKVTTK